MKDSRLSGLRPFSVITVCQLSLQISHEELKVGSFNLHAAAFNLHVEVLKIPSRV